MNIGSLSICALLPMHNCGIPLSLWLTVMFIFVCLDILIREMNQRMKNNSYWTIPANRRLKKYLTRIIVSLKEISEIGWATYGVFLYFSPQSDGCSDKNRGFMALMMMLLVLSGIKLVIIIISLFALCILAWKSHQRRRDIRTASNSILRSLARIKYSTLSLAQTDTDEECSICFVDYTQNDFVTKLDCNEKHIFHEQCIGSWIQQGKNSCPICRSTINSQIQL